MKYKLHFKALDVSATRKQIEAVLASYGYTPKKRETWINYATYGEYKNSSGKFIEIEYKLKVINTMEDMRDLPISRKVQQIINELKTFGIMLPAEWAEKNVPSAIHNGLIMSGLDKPYMLLYQDGRSDASYKAYNLQVPEVVHLKLKEKQFTMLLGNADEKYKLSPLAAKIYRLFDEQGWELDDPDHNVDDWWNAI